MSACPVLEQTVLNLTVEIVGSTKCLRPFGGLVLLNMTGPIPNPLRRPLPFLSLSASSSQVKMVRPTRIPGE